MPFASPGAKHTAKTTATGAVGATSRLRNQRPTGANRGLETAPTTTTATRAVGATSRSRSQRSGEANRDLEIAPTSTIATGTVGATSRSRSQRPSAANRGLETAPTTTIATGTVGATSRSRSQRPGGANRGLETSSYNNNRHPSRGSDLQVAKPAFGRSGGGYWRNCSERMRSSSECSGSNSRRWVMLCCWRTSTRVTSRNSS